MSQTIGVLGGMGPYATLDFLRLLLDESNPSKESGHFRVLVDNNPRIPGRTRAFLYGEEDPVPQMRQGVSFLASGGADFIVVPCNSAHYFLPRVFEGQDISYVDMVAATSRLMTDSGYERVGVLAGEVTVGARLYEQCLSPVSVEVIQVDESRQKLVRSVIEDVKGNQIDDSTRESMSRLVDFLHQQKADAIVLGCTELQAVIRDMQFDVPLVDSTTVLAKEAVKRAGS